MEVVEIRKGGGRGAGKGGRGSEGDVVGRGVKGVEAGGGILILCIAVAFRPLALASYNAGTEHVGFHRPARHRVYQARSALKGVRRVA